MTEFYEALTIAVGLIVLIGIVCIALAKSPAVPDTKRVNELLADNERLTSELERAKRNDYRGKDGKFAKRPS